MLSQSSNFSPFDFLHPAAPPLPQAIFTPLSLSIDYACMFFGYLFLCCILHPHDYSLITNLYHSIPSLLLPNFPTSLPSGNHQNSLCIYDSISVLLVGLFFLDSIVDRYVFVAILLFIFFTFFFLQETI